MILLGERDDCFPEYLRIDFNFDFNVFIDFKYIYSFWIIALSPKEST